MDVGLIDSLLREAEAEAEAEAELWTLQTRHIAAHASGPPALRKRAREGPGGLLHLTRQTGEASRAPPAKRLAQPQDSSAAGPSEGRPARPIKPTNTAVRLGLAPMRRTIQGPDGAASVLMMPSASEVACGDGQNLGHEWQGCTPGRGCRKL